MKILNPAMRIIFLLSVLAFGIQACTNNAKEETSLKMLQNKVDSLNLFVQKMKPGLGELMTNIQLHHEKLWFAGTGLNWKLADFEIGEIKETVDQAKEIETDRPETKSLTMLSEPINAINHDIEKQDINQFKKDYGILTQTCNTCHTANHFEFNVITIPSAPTVSDQDFKTLQVR